MRAVVSVRIGDCARASLRPEALWAYLAGCSWLELTPQYGLTGLCTCPRDEHEDEPRNEPYAMG